jgi:hypothetical protein
MPSKSNGIIPDKEKPVYDAGEIVFAKLKGYPWWPAKVKETMVIVRYKGVELMFADRL